MKQSIKICVVGALLIAPVLGVVANQVFAQTTPRLRSAQFGSSANGGDFNYGRAEAGRFQLSSNAKGANYIFDTATGKCWVQTGQGVNSKEWEEISPKWAINRGKPQGGTVGSSSDLDIN